MIVKSDDESIERAAQAIRAGELVAFPTETVYGLGANAFNETAVRRIFTVKGRPATNPLIVHVPDVSLIHTAVSSDLSARQRRQLDALKVLWPGPLSVVLPKHSAIVDVVTATRNTVAIRVPAHEVARKFLDRCGVPVAAPSANPSSYVSPTTAQHVVDSFGDKVSIVLDGGASEVGLESTVISLLGDIPELLRPGGITLETLQELLGEVHVPKHSARVAAAQEPALSPGLLSTHYAPRTKLLIRDTVNSLEELPPRVGLLAFSTRALFSDEREYAAIRTLSENENMPQIAANLFAALRDLDTLGLDLILVDSCPERGLGRAVMDRLIRAAH